jgi:hypothetical protein
MEPYKTRMKRLSADEIWELVEDPFNFKIAKHERKDLLIQNAEDQCPLPMPPENLWEIMMKKENENVRARFEGTKKALKAMRLVFLRARTEFAKTSKGRNTLLLLASEMTRLKDDMLSMVMKTAGIRVQRERSAALLSESDMKEIHEKRQNDMLAAIASRPVWRGRGRGRGHFRGRRGHRGRPGNKP